MQRKRNQKKRSKNKEKNEAYMEVISNMVYDGKDAAELADDLRLRANDCFRRGTKKDLKVAYELYTDALEYSAQVEDSQENRTRYATILSNRAAVQLAKQNYGSALRDCANALKYGPEVLANVKVFYRACLAAKALEKYDQVVHYADAGLKIEPSNKELIELRDKGRILLAEQERLARRKEKLEWEMKRFDQQLRKALIERKIRYAPLTTDFSSYAKDEALVPTINAAINGALSWPIVILYPESGQTDFISSALETSTLEEQLAPVFEIAPEWDANGHYKSLKDLAVYYESWNAIPYDLNKPLAPQKAELTEKGMIDWKHEKKFVRIPSLRITIQQAVTLDGFVIAGIPCFYVVSKRGEYYKTHF